MEIRPEEAEFHADGQTEMTKLTVAFRNFSKAPKTSQDSTLGNYEQLDNIKMGLREMGWIELAKDIPLTGFHMYSDGISGFIRPGNFCVSD